jgi:uncharacterized membrane protein YbaN (DUF454 family)
MHRILFIGLGWIFVALATFGVILPVLPTTPFLLLAVACFARSSPRFHDWLLYRSWFSSYLQFWYQYRAMPPGTKWKAVCLLLVTFGFSFYLVSLLWVRLLLAVILASLLFFFYRLPVVDLSQQK